MTRDFKVYIEDILENLEIIVEYVEGITEEEFNQNRQLQDAVIRRFEIVGEAAKQIPAAQRNESLLSRTCRPEGILQMTPFRSGYRHGHQDGQY